MAFLEWSDDLSVNYRLMDTDHKRLIDLINQVHDASLNHDEPEKTIAAIDSLVDFAKTHFTHEETLMRKTAYPKFIPHKIEHDRLVQQLDDLRRRQLSGHPNVSHDTVIFLRTWLCDHLVKVDKPLGEWLGKHAPL